MLRLDNSKKRIRRDKELDRIYVSNKLKEIRKNLKITMRKEAEILNTTSSVVSNFENNKTLILSSFLLGLSKYSNYSIDWILGRSSIKKNGTKNKKDKVKQT